MLTQALGTHLAANTGTLPHPSVRPFVLAIFGPDCNIKHHRRIRSNQHTSSKRTRMEQQRSSAGSIGDPRKDPITTASSDNAPRAMAEGSDAASKPSAEFLLHVVQQINQSFQSSLTKVGMHFVYCICACVVSEIGQEYGLAMALAQMETGDTFGALEGSGEELRSQKEPVPADVRLIIQELQSSRQKEKELRRQVEDLQTEQKLAKQRLALYSLYALKLKRELVNERLAHIDSKKEVEELRSIKQPAPQGDSGDERESTAARAGGRPLSASQDAANRNSNPEEDEDPWSSPGKGRSGGNAASGHLLSFSSFYSSRHNEGGAGSEDSPPSPMSSVSSGLHPLRNSLMGQFLPSTLLDSPQITPSSRSSTSSKSAFRKEDRLTFDAEIKDAMQPFSLSEPPCTQCKQNPVTECVPCGHKLCADHEGNMLARNELICPRCSAKVSSIKEVRRQEDNQVDHLLEGDILEEKAPSGTSLSSPGGRGSSSFVVSPITLSVMSELFESIPVDQLEAALKESSGQPSLAMESLLHSHPSFNPGTSTSESSPIAPGHRAALHRANSGPSSSSQGGGTGGAGPSGGTTSNWKTEMCMYYLQGKCNKTRRTCSFAHGESDLVRTNTSKHASSAGYKTRLCPLYLEGICPKSRRDCPMAHGESDLRDGLAVLTSNTVLPSAAPRLQSYKTELCYYYLKGCCNYTKEECRFAHGESDLRTVESNTMEWTAKLAASGGAGSGSDFPPSGPALVSSGPPGLTLDKQLQHQHQYQQQFQQPQQFVPSQQQQQQHFQQPQQPPQHPQLQHGSPGFPPPHQVPLQHAMPPHQYGSFAQQQQQQQQHAHPPPPHMAPMQQHGHHPQMSPPPQGLYHQTAASHQYRYIKSMDEAAKRSAGARPPPQPRGREPPSWSTGGGEF
ncbi:hypothetical protein FI667_g12521, partial [Globisporangium splendens]